MLHPRRKPTRSQLVPSADGLHSLAVSDYGPIEADAHHTVCYLHGGPGGGTPPDVPRLFDEHIHLVVFDQRGCGQSVCANRLRANTTELLLEDVETVREALGIEKWGVMGSSYGSLLATMYCARHAPRVSWALLHGVFLGSQAEVEWLYEEGGASRFYPQQWAEFKGFTFAADEASYGNALSAGETGTAPTPEALAAAHVDATFLDAAHPPPRLLSKYHQQLNLQPSLDESVRANPIPDDAPFSAVPTLVAAAAALTRWEDEMETLVPCPASHDPAELVAGAQVAAHFFYHGCFLPAEGALPELTSAAAAAALSSVPCAIIHGRHDVICPPRAAATLRALWGKSSLRIVEGGAHALFEKPMRSAAQACLAELTEQNSAGSDPSASSSGSKRRRG